MPQQRGRTARNTFYNVRSRTHLAPSYRRTQLTYEQSPRSNPRHPQYVSRQEYYRQRRAYEARVARDREHFERYYPHTSRDWTPGSYLAIRNTANRQVLLPPAPERGVRGERGPPGVGVQGPRGVTGPQGPPGVDVTERPKIIMTSNMHGTSDDFWMWAAAIAQGSGNIFTDAQGGQGFYRMYTNIEDMEHRLFRSWSTQNGPYEGGVINGADPNYPYPYTDKSRWLGFRLKPGVWKCACYGSGANSSAYLWFEDTDKNRSVTFWSNDYSEYRSDFNKTTGPITYVTIPAGSDRLLGLYVSVQGTDTASWSAPVIEIEQVSAFNSTDGPATAYVTPSTAFAPKWEQLAFNASKRISYI